MDNEEIVEENANGESQAEGSARITPEQLNAMLYYMEQHSEFAANKLLGANGKESKKAQWQRLADLVSSCGPAKDIKQLQAVWSRQRGKAKEYNAEKVRAARRTGNHTEVRFIENPIMEKILKIVGTTHKNGLEIVPEVGIAPAKLKRKPKKSIIVYELPLSLTTTSGASPVTAAGEIKMKNASLTSPVTRPLHSAATTSTCTSESAATPANSALFTASATPALHQSASATGSGMKDASIPPNKEASTTSVTRALLKSQSASLSATISAATPDNPVINTRRALHHSAHVSASAAHHSKPYDTFAVPPKYTSRRLKVINPTKEMTLSRCVTPAPRQSESSSGSTSEAAATVDKEGINSSIRQTLHHSAYVGASTEQAPPKFTTRSSSRVTKLTNDTQSNCKSEMEETAENKFSASLEYSKIYSSYVSSWQKNAKASKDAKKEVALAAVAENSNSINKLVKTVIELKEVQAKKCEILRRHCRKTEQYYEERMKLWWSNGFISDDFI
ncbi:uncharacterized protein LOC116416112 [Nasonia vitripennis]|uniref:Regulatory protein zeste n=1 Tax=Nasonia vitripennis TaxID=7425 RepID=A0A7M7Q2U0_NASVI|nr:uncharacterized protein LOC116416112 [Nasonia vitripennis]